MWAIKRYLFPPMSKTVSRPTWSAEPKSAFTSSKLPHSAFLVRVNHACNGFFAGGCFRQKSRKLFCEMTCMLYRLHDVRRGSDFSKMPNTEQRRVWQIAKLPVDA